MNKIVPDSEKYYEDDKTVWQNEEWPGQGGEQLIETGWPMKALLVEMTFERRGENTRKGQSCQEGMCLDYLQKNREKLLW